MQTKIEPGPELGAAAPSGTLGTMSSPRRAIVAFYASKRHGSEYRAGAEFIHFAAEAGFDLAIIADLEQNSSPSDLRTGELQIQQVASPVVKQRLLYRFTDFIPQLIWHVRVARHLRTLDRPLDVLWIQNGALPWLPLAPYRDVAKRIIWGPVGGGAGPAPATLATLNRSTRIRESLRSGIEGFFLRRKRRLFSDHGFPKVIAVARTHEAQANLQYMAPGKPAPVIPEILDPIAAMSRARKPTTSPRFVWVGQNIPRKNLPVALDLFARMRTQVFPEATLDVYGVSPSEADAVPGVHFQGWVSRIDWDSYRDDGVLLLTSYREGLPSVVLEATSAGLLCAVADVGSLGSLGLPTMHVLNHVEYPFYSDSTVQQLAERVRAHLASEHVEIHPINFRSRLQTYLNEYGAF